MVCSECKKSIPQREVNYSVKHYGTTLCRDCQKNSSKEKSYQKKKGKSTDEAIKLCEILIKMGFKAQLEKYDGYKHIDIAIPNVKVNIEVDGMQHSYSEKQALADLKRTFYSWKKGYVTVRIPNKLIKEKAYDTAKFIKKFIEASAEQLEEENESHTI